MNRFEKMFSPVGMGNNSRETSEKKDKITEEFVKHPDWAKDKYKSSDIKSRERELKEAERVARERDGGRFAQLRKKFHGMETTNPIDVLQEQALAEDRRREEIKREVETEVRELAREAAKKTFNDQPGPPETKWFFINRIDEVLSSERKLDIEDVKKAFRMVPDYYRQELKKWEPDGEESKGKKDWYVKEKRENLQASIDYFEKPEVVDKWAGTFMENLRKNMLSRLREKTIRELEISKERLQAKSDEYRIEKIKDIAGDFFMAGFSVAILPMAALVRLWEEISSDSGSGGGSTGFTTSELEQIGKDAADHAFHMNIRLGGE